MSVCKPPTEDDLAGSRRLILVGVSCRAAAWSAARAGFAICACDAFADADLLKLASDSQVAARGVDKFPEGLLAIWSDLPDAPWLYAGGLENHAELIDELAASRRLLGNAGRVVRRARDPAEIQRILTDAGLSAPDLRPAGDPPASGRWMRKPLRSGGGIGVALVDFSRGAEAEAATTRVESHSRRPSDPAVDRATPADPGCAGFKSREFYYQRWIAGTSCGATFVAANGEARLLGVCMQLHGRNWPEPGEFHYAGSIGPLPLPPEVFERVDRLGSCLARELELVGVFGVDLVLDDGIPWQIEINPRWPASAEVIERASGVSVARIHWDACMYGILPAASLARDSGGRVAGKAIVYADRDTDWSDDATRWCLANRGPSPRDFPLIADIPVGATSLPSQSPLLTVLADDMSVACVRETLLRRKRSVRERCCGDE